MTAIRLSPLLLLASVHASALDSLTSMEGIYETSAGSDPVVVELMSAEGVIEGSLQWRDKLYVIECDNEEDDEEDELAADEGEPAETDAEGSVVCSGVAYEVDAGTLTYLEMVDAETQTALLLYVNGDLEEPIEIALVDAASTPAVANPDSNEATAKEGTVTSVDSEDIDNVVRAPALVGLWVNSGSHVSGEIGAAWESYMQLSADGIMQVTEARMSGGGSLGSFSGGGEEVLTARWKADGQSLFFAADDASVGGWHLLGTYVLREPSLLVQHVDGTRLLYRRAQ